MEQMHGCEGCDFDVCAHCKEEADAELAEHAAQHASKPEALQLALAATEGDQSLRRVSDWVLNHKTSTSKNKNIFPL